MNTFKLIPLFALALSLSLAFTACSQNGTHNHDHGDHNEVVTVDYPKEEASAIIAAYLEVKNALVATDGAAASAAANNLLTAITSTNEIANNVKAQATTIANTEDTDEQREAFNTLSQQIYELAKGTSAFDTPLYKQYCPMAFDNTGAYWLASEKEVNNPYFGDMMLHCGKVQETIK